MSLIAILLIHVHEIVRPHDLNFRWVNLNCTLGPLPAEEPIVTSKEAAKPRGRYSENPDPA